ncbi:hypothetical protein VULLAG_LOCUS19134 [Vulpes lagopus]
MWDDGGSSSPFRDRASIWCVPRSAGGLKPPQDVPAPWTGVQRARHSRASAHPEHRIHWVYTEDGTRQRAPQDQGSPQHSGAWAAQSRRGMGNEQKHASTGLGRQT